MRIRTSINHQYSIIALRRKKRILAIAAIAMVCTAVTNLAIEAGIVTTADNTPAFLRPGDTLTASSANARLRIILDDKAAGTVGDAPTSAAPQAPQHGMVKVGAAGSIEKLSPLKRR